MQSNNYKLEYESKRVSAETAPPVVRNGYRLPSRTGAGIVHTLATPLAPRVRRRRSGRKARSMCALLPRISALSIAAWQTKATAGTCR